jgi:hypothetical protein
MVGISLISRDDGFVSSAAVFRPPFPVQALHPGM